MGTHLQGITFNKDDMRSNQDKVRQLCGSRSSGTVLKRANSLLQYCKWHRQFFYQRKLSPLQTKDISEHIWERKQDGASLSTWRSFTEAVNFQGSRAWDTPSDRGYHLSTVHKMGHRSSRSSEVRRKQARPITVREVCHLEACVVDISSGL